jgi:hypothetical protein
VGKSGVAAGIITFLVGLAIFVDDLHDFVEGTEFLHWLPDFDPFFIGTFQLHHLYIGVLIMLIGLYVAVRYDE